MAKGGLDFSVQQVADRAGVTHRTVYNHFPTREAMREALAVHVEERLSRSHTPPDAAGITLDGLPQIAADSFAIFEANSSQIRAYVVLMLASRGFAGVMKKRSAELRKAIEAHPEFDAPISPHAVASAVRMFFSPTGWHLLTELYGLSPAEASATARWAAQSLLDAATKKGPRRRKQ